MKKKDVSSDPYQLQRVALLAADKNSAPGDLRAALAGLTPEREEQLLELIIDQGLHFFWLEAIKTLGELSFYSMSRGRLKESCFMSTTRYLSQKKLLMEIDTLLNKVGCVYAVFKGAQVRETVYLNPVYRPSIDIDLLISPDDKKTVLQTLVAAGFTMYPDPANVSHEVSLIKDGVFVDLHWDIMRPGRTRINMVQEFLLGRQRNEFFWGLDNEAALFMMLVHPVFTKYSTAPQSALVRLIDICNWLENRKITWSRLVDLVTRSGMKTASWITLTVLHHLTGQRFPEMFIKAVIPGRLKQQMLRYWLQQNLSARFVNYPLFTKYIFTILAHDSTVDAFSFLRRAAKAKAQQQSIVAELKEMFEERLD